MVPGEAHDTQNSQNRFTDSFSKATVKTLSDMCGTPVELGASFVKGRRDQIPFAVGGMIGVNSAHITGFIGLCFPKMVFLNLVEKMLGEPQTEVGPGNEDAAAELLNIIFGLAKTLLNKDGEAVQMAIPSILRGGEVHSSYARGSEARVIPLKLPDGSEFYLEFVLKNLDARQRKEQEASERKSISEKTGKTPQEIQAAFFRPFIDGVIKAMSVQCRLEARPDKPFSRRSTTDYSFDIAGMIGITSRSVNAVFLLGFDREVYLRILSRMIGETYRELEPGMEDAAAEIVNIVFGAAKTVLNEGGHGLHMAIPSVVFGRQIFSAYQNAHVPGVVVPFETELGRFYAEILIQ